ncbi:hypothetical protein SGPA1_11886 [Streptomyces misionensis JCM 4497]
MVGCEGEGARGHKPAHRAEPELAGGNREDLRQGTAPALRLLAAGHRPRVHAHRRRPVRGRGRTADPGRRPGTLAVRVLVQPGAAAQVPARLGAGPRRRTARRRPARPGVRRARLVERGHRRHRPPGLAAGPPRLAGVRAEGARGRRGRRGTARHGAGQRGGTTLPGGRGRGGVGPPSGPRTDRGAVHSAALLRPALGRGRPARRRSARRAHHLHRAQLPGLRRDRAVGALARPDLGGAAGGGHRGRPGRAGAAGRRRRVRGGGLVVLGAAAVPDVQRVPDAVRRGRGGPPGPARPQRTRSPGPAGPSHRRSAVGPGARVRGGRAALAGAGAAGRLGGRQSRLEGLAGLGRGLLSSG